MAFPKTKKGHFNTPKVKWGFFAFGMSIFFFGIASFGIASDMSTEAVLRFTNQDRNKKNLPALVLNDQLSKAANLKAEDMIKKDYFAHTSPEGLSPWHWMKEAGYRYQFAGENLAVHFDSAEAQEQAWMKSETHRRNILNPSYTEAGIAVVEGNINGKKTFVSVVLFGSPKGGVILPKEPATSEALPLVKGADTQVTAGHFAGVRSSPLGAFIQQQKNWLGAHQGLFMEVLESVSTILLYLSLVLPAVVFTGKGYSEILFQPKKI